MENQAKYSIKTASRLSGLSPYVIRAWERRYNILVPQRTETNRRLYSEADVEKLRLLGQAVKKGSTIGNVASLSVDELKKLNLKEEDALSSMQARGQHKYDSYLNECVDAIEKYDSTLLGNTLERAAIDMDFEDLLGGLLIPLINKIGEEWYNGELRIAQEHMASSVLEAFLKTLLRRYRVSPNAPVTLMVTPKGQMHELGLLLAAIAAASEGWNVIELGPDLPAKEIEEAAKFSQAKAVCLSIVYPDEEAIPGELRTLGKLLKGKSVIVGGRAARLYREILGKEGFMLIEDFTDFRKVLAEIAK